jgi:nitrate reductase NapD
VHFSSIVVTALPSDFPSCVQSLESLPGIEVHLRYPERGRIVVTQETHSVEAQEEGLRRIQATPCVVSAELVYHYVESEEQEEDSEKA